MCVAEGIERSGRTLMIGTKEARGLFGLPGDPHTARDASSLAMPTSAYSHMSFRQEYITECTECARTSPEDPMVMAGSGPCSLLIIAAICCHHTPHAGPS